jgi:hypothetical protein
MSNDPRRNTVVVFNRDADGKLRPAGTYATGGTGSGAFEDAANGVVLGDANGEAAPNNLTDATRLLFVVNAGSNSLSVFRVNQDDDANGRKDALELVTVRPSGGEKPVSLTVNRGLLYVLHSGETVDGEIATPNCTTGDRPSITGFRVSAAGQLTPIPGSTRRLQRRRALGLRAGLVQPRRPRARRHRTSGPGRGPDGSRRRRGRHRHRTS